MKQIDAPLTRREKTTIRQVIIFLENKRTILRAHNEVAFAEYINFGHGLSIPSYGFTRRNTKVDQL